MGFSIWNLIKASLLVVNAFAVLHPQRFLRAHGLDGSPDAAGGDGVKHQLGVLFTAARMMRGAWRARAVGVGGGVALCRARWASRSGRRARRLAAPCRSLDAPPRPRSPAADLQ